MLTCAQRRNYRDRRDVFRPATGILGTARDANGDPIGGKPSAFVAVAGEQGIPCQFVSPGNEFQEGEGGFGQIVVPSRRTARSLREEFGRDTQAGDVIRLVTRAGVESWHTVKAKPDQHPNDGSRRLNYQSYDLAPAIALQRQPTAVGGIWSGLWVGIN